MYGGGGGGGGSPHYDAHINKRIHDGFKQYISASTFTLCFNSLQVQYGTDLASSPGSLGTKLGTTGGLLPIQMFLNSACCLCFSYGSPSIIVYYMYIHFSVYSGPYLLHVET